MRFARTLLPAPAAETRNTASESLTKWPDQGLDCVILRQCIDAQAIELATSCGAAMETMIQIDLGQVCA